MTSDKKWKVRYFLTDIVKVNICYFQGFRWFYQPLFLRLINKITDTVFYISVNRSYIILILILLFRVAICFLPGIVYLNYFKNGNVVLDIYLSDFFETQDCGTRRFMEKRYDGAILILSIYWIQQVSRVSSHRFWLNNLFICTLELFLRARLVNRESKVVIGQ